MGRQSFRPTPGVASGCWSSVMTRWDLGGGGCTDSRRSPPLPLPSPRWERANRQGSAVRGCQSGRDRAAAAAGWAGASGACRRGRNYRSSRRWRTSPSLMPRRGSSGESRRIGFGGCGGVAGVGVAVVVAIDGSVCAPLELHVLLLRLSSTQTPRCHPTPVRRGPYYHRATFIRPRDCSAIEKVSVADVGEAVTCAPLSAEVFAMI